MKGFFIYFDCILAKIIKILDTKDQGIAEDNMIPGGANVYQRFSHFYWSAKEFTRGAERMYGQVSAPGKLVC